MVKQWKKRPIVIEALQWTGKNVDEVLKFCSTAIINIPTHVSTMFDLEIPTLEGNHVATVGDYIIKGIKGEFYPCKSDIFLASYDECGSESKLNVSSKKSLKEHGIEYTADGLRLADADTLVKASGKDLVRLISQQITVETKKP